MKSHMNALTSMPSDNQRPFWPLKLVVAISLGLTIFKVDASVVPNNVNEQQQLTNEKLALRLISVSNNNNLDRYQQVNGALNDLVDRPEAQVDSSRQRWAELGQMEPTKRLVGQGGSVINGNHATYVEPPADFKPIIYDTNRQQQQHQDKALEPTVQTMPNENSDFYFNQFKPSIASSDLSLAQQQQQQLQDRLQSAAGSAVDPVLINSSGFSDFSTASHPGKLVNQQQQRGIKKSSLAGGFQEENSMSSQTTDKLADNQDRLKPSIGRWSEWHDMSIEPDLASSDSLASFQPMRPFGAVNLPAAPYKTRYRASTATKGALVQQSKPEQLKGDAAREQTAGEAIGTAPFTGHQVSVKRQTGALTQQQQLQIKGGQQAADQSSLPVTGAAASASGQLAIKGSKLPLKFISGNEANSKQGFKARQPHGQHQPMNEFSYIQHNQQASFRQQADGNQAAPTLQTGDPGQAKQPRRVKRRRKSKTNAEVRIQQLVADSQQKQQQQQQQQQQQHPELSGAGKQVNGLGAANQEKEPRSIQQQQSVAVEALKLQDKQPSMQNKQQVSGERVLGKQLTNPIQPHQRPLVLRKLSSSSQSNANSTSIKQGGANAKRRRIKTLLPVGLSSWFLGGIRDLDGRHWQLPAEVINRLAVNDVDFVNSGQQTTIKPVVSPAVGSVIIIEPERQVGGSIIASEPPVPAVLAPAQRVPISQLIPRRKR